MDQKEPQPRVEDILPVRSRVSWGAVLAGAVIAIGIYLLLTLLGGAVGLSLSTTNIRNSTLGWAATIWAIFSFAVSLFCGGYVTTLLAVGENRTEAILHGVLMWGMMLAFSTWLATTGVTAGYSTLLHMAYLNENASNVAGAGSAEELARALGGNEEDATKFRELADGIRNRRTDDPEVRDTLRAGQKAAWWTVFGTVLSIACAVGGAICGSGPVLRFLDLGGRRMVMARSELANR